MNEPSIEIENKLKQQVLHILGTHTEHLLFTKIYDLAFEWYMKGLHSGLTSTVKLTKDGLE